MMWIFDVRFADEPRIAERLSGFTSGLIQAFVQFPLRPDDDHPLSTATGTRFQENRKREFRYVFFGDVRQRRNPEFFGQLFSGKLISHEADRFWGRSDPNHPCVDHGLGKVGVFGEKSPAWMDGIALGRLGRMNDVWNV